jgi:hypothetical protein
MRIQLIFAVLFPAVLNVGAQTLLLDTFQSPDTSFSGSSPFQVVGDPSAIGGEVRVALYGGSGSSAFIGGSSLVFNKADTDTTLLLRYGDTGLNYGGGNANGSDLNLNLSAYHALEVNLARTVGGLNGPPNALLALFYDGSNYGQAAVNINLCCGFNSGGFVGNIDWSHIHGIELQLPSPVTEAGTYELDVVRFSTIPEPSFWASITAAALCGFAVFRRAARTRQN